FTPPLLINKTSPLAVKTTGAAVVFILAPPSGGTCQLKILPSRSACFFLLRKFLLHFVCNH
ncbi:MAG: hypothetical protein IJ564_03030, partial [Alphaproteobacteria bacterium]|nr:hypothetical protein [Alphaproteobacteria bacterium]